MPPTINNLIDQMMEHRSLVFLVLAAGAIAMAAWGLTRLLMERFGGDQRKLQKRLNNGPAQMDRVDYAQITLERLPGDFSYWERKLAHSYPNVTPARFFALAVMLAIVGFALTAVAMDSYPMGILLGAVLGVAPFIVVNIKCARRRKRLSDQLPQALDFLSRVLRAGHSLSTALQMVGEELPDPIGREFRLCYAEHSVGKTLDDSIKGMAERIQTSDFAFFASALLIQRQTGGDLAEILGNIGTMVRNRMKLERHVQAISAEGRLTGNILICFPFVMYLVINFMNPSYTHTLIETNIGRVLIVIGFVMLTIGFLLIRKIVAVKV